MSFLVLNLSPRITMAIIVFMFCKLFLKI
uniref:Uncharacterized protein n=1 Tax=Rhizophora mucronata TaxID=61149 RepID=A0A2P2PFN6_RHIMU